MLESVKYADIVPKKLTRLFSMSYVKYKKYRSKYVKRQK